MTTPVSNLSTETMWSASPAIYGMPAIFLADQSGRGVYLSLWDLKAAVADAEEFLADRK